MSPITGGSPGPAGEWALCPAVPGEGFVSSGKFPSQIVPRPYSLMCYLLIRWRVGQWGREEVGEGNGLLRLCWQHRGGALSQLLFPAPSLRSQVGTAWPQQDLVPSLCSTGPHPLSRVRLCQCVLGSASSAGGLKTPETCCSDESPMPPRGQLKVHSPGPRKDGASPAPASVAVCVTPVMLTPVTATAA